MRPYFEVIMLLKEASRQFKLPLDDLKAMEKEGLLSEPLDDQSINNLAFLRYLWNNPVWLRRQLSRMNAKARLLFVRTVEFSKVETYIFSRYFNAPRGRHIEVGSVASELTRYYGIPITGELIRKIHAMRRKAQDARYYDRVKKRNAALQNPEPPGD